MNISSGSSTAELSPWSFVCPPGLWSNGLAQLTDSGGWMHGPAARFSSATTHEILAEGMHLTQDAPQGKDLPANTAWYAVHSMDAENISLSEIGRLMAACRPRPSQTFVLLLIDTNDWRKWLGIVCEFSQYRQLATMHLLGGGTLHLETPAGPSSDERYSRLEGVLGSRLTELRNMSVTLVGAGRLGTLMAWQLASLGIRRLRILDGDIQERWNLDAVGQKEQHHHIPKVIALGATLAEFRNDLELTLIAKSIRDRSTWPLLEERSDLIVTAVDDDLARYVVSLIARKRQMLHLDLASRVSRDSAGQTECSGDVRLLYPGEGCTGCIGGYQNEAVIERELLASPGALPMRRPLPWHVQRVGSLLPLNQIVVGAAGMLILESIDRKILRSTWQRLLWREGFGIETETADVGRGNQCPICLGKKTLPY